MLKREIRITMLKLIKYFFVLTLVLSFYRCGKGAPFYQGEAHPPNPWLVSWIQSGCYNSPKAPDFCNQANSLKLKRDNLEFCGLSTDKGTFFIYDENNNIIRGTTVANATKFQCKTPIGNANVNYFLPGVDFRWYKYDSLTKTGTFLFTHKIIDSKNVDFFTNFRSGDSLYCCWEYYKEQFCKDSYFEILCRPINIQ